MSINFRVNVNCQCFFPVKVLGVKKLVKENIENILGEYFKAFNYNMVPTRELFQTLRVLTIHH